MKRETKQVPKQTTVVDWSEVHRRIEAFRGAIERGWTPTPEEKKKILRARARDLSREMTEGEAGEDYLEVVEFLLAYERYGVESSFVRQVYPLKELTPLPGTPPFVLGIINVRGQILSVIDIKNFFDLPEKGLTDLNKVIILRSDGMPARPSDAGQAGGEFGILADVILGVRNVAVKELQPSLPTLTGIREEYLKGVTKERVVILDAEKLLSAKNIIVHEEVEG